MVQFISSKVLEHQILTDKFHLIRLKLLQKPFNLQAGQFVVMKVGDSLFRSYSVASAPNMLPEWEMIIDVSPNGPGSKYINNLQTGNFVETTQPRGIFVFKDDLGDKVVFGATGCGIASIKPMVEELLEKGKKRVYLFWGLRFKKDLFLLSYLDDLSKRYQYFHYQIVLSRPEGEWDGLTGHITEHLCQLVKSLPTEKTSVYLCGNGKMVTGIIEKCSDINFPCDKIYFEKYG